MRRVTPKRSIFVFIRRSTFSMVDTMKEGNIMQYSGVDDSIMCADAEHDSSVIGVRERGGS